MASNPTIVSCGADAWTKVATNVTSGTVTPKIVTTQYSQTYVVTADPAPSGLSLALPLSNDGAAIAADAGIDVYVYAHGEAGSVRVDL